MMYYEYDVLMYHGSTLEIIQGHGRLVLKLEDMCFSVRTIDFTGTFVS